MKRNAKKRKKRVKALMWENYKAEWDSDFQEILAKLDLEDVSFRNLDGKETSFFSLRGFLIVGFLAWKLHGKPKGKELVRLYCRYISMRGYLGGANEAMGKLSSMETAEGVEWIKSTFDKYVTDQMDLVRHIGFVLAT